MQTDQLRVVEHEIHPVGVFLLVDLAAAAMIHVVANLHQAFVVDGVLLEIAGVGDGVLEPSALRLSGSERNKKRVDMFTFPIKYLSCLVVFYVASVGHSYSGENDVLVVSVAAVVSIHTYVVSRILVIQVERGRKITEWDNAVGFRTLGFVFD